MTTETSPNQPLPFENQLKALEELVFKKQDITDQTAHLLVTINAYPDSIQDENSLPLSEGMREVMLESALNDIRKHTSEEAALAFAREAVAQMSLQLEADVPRYAQWQLDVPSENRALIVEALLNRFPEIAALQAEFTAANAVHPEEIDVEAVEMEELMRGHIPLVSLEQSLSDEERFKQELLACADEGSLRSLLEDRAEAAKDELLSGGFSNQRIGQLESMLRANGYSYNEVVKLVNNLTVVESERLKLREIVNVSLLRSAAQHIRSDDVNKQKRAEAYFPYFSEPAVAAAAREVFEMTKGDLASNGYGELKPPKPIEEMTDTEFKTYLHDKSEDVDSFYMNRTIDSLRSPEMSPTDKKLWGKLANPLRQPNITEPYKKLKKALEKIEAVKDRRLRGFLRQNFDELTFTQARGMFFVNEMRAVERGYAAYLMVDHFASTPEESNRMRAGLDRMLLIASTEALAMYSVPPENVAHFIQAHASEPAIARKIMESLSLPLSNEDQSSSDTR